MNPRRIHNRLSFYKYASANAAKSILAGTKLRWSMPNLFNDPFDVPREILDGVDACRRRNALVTRMNALVENPTLPDPEHWSEMTRLLIRGFSQADAALKRQLLEANEKSRREPIGTDESLEDFRNEWRLMYGAQRILCLTEEWDSASMWDRYSVGHSGVVLGFGCLDHLDSAWLLAKPVSYTDEPIRLNTPEGLAELMFYDPKFAAAKIMEQYTHTKTTDWAYEREWRVASWKRPHEIGNFSDYEFVPDELQDVILGASISSADEESLLGIVRRQYPHAKLWRAGIGSGRKLTRSALPESG